MSAVNPDYDVWTNVYYSLEAVTNEGHVHYQNVQITRDLLSLVHSAAAGFDHSAEIWPRVRDALNETFRSPHEKLRYAIDCLMIDANCDGVCADPATVNQHLQAALDAM